MRSRALDSIFWPILSLFLTTAVVTACQPPGPVPSAATPVTIAAAEAIPSAAWANLEPRPLKLAALTPGAACPISAPHQASSFNVTGEGPIYLVQPGTIHYGKGKLTDGWHYVKAPWLSAPSYPGPALIRGRQLDGPNAVRFERSGPHSTSGLPVLQFPVDTGVSSLDLAPGWRFQPASIGFRAPGCYGLQVDGTSFTTAIVIEAQK
ncbi:MAG: hypothetical protein ACREOS_11490 [Candidatus Dormibacteraceae bacterium]